MGQKGNKKNNTAWSTGILPDGMSMETIFITETILDDGTQNVNN
jgi:hypothetical protein